MKTRGLKVFFVLLLTGCAPYSLIEPGRRSIGALYTVDSHIAWSASSSGKLESWTIDGPSLQALQFVKGLEEGDLLFESTKKGPRFKRSLTPFGAMDFVVASFAVAGRKGVKGENLRPAPFGKVEGFRFEIRYLSKDGLERRGFIMGTIVSQRLYLIMYLGTRAHYYDKHEKDVERIVKTIRFEKP